MRTDKSLIRRISRIILLILGYTNIKSVELQFVLALIFTVTVKGKVAPGFKL